MAYPEVRSSIVRPHVTPIYDPEGSDVGSNYAGPLQSQTRITRSDLSSLREAIEAHSIRQPERAQSDRIQANKRHPGKSTMSSVVDAIHGEPQCLVPSYSVERDPAIIRFYRQGPPGEPPMEFTKPSYANPEESIGQPTDGGLMAWLHVLAGFLVIFNAHYQSYGVFQAYYQSVLLPLKRPDTIAWIGSLQIFLLFSMTIVVNPLFDKGHFRLCFTGGSVLLAFSVLLTSWCTELWQLLLVQGAMTGAGMGLIYGSGCLVLMTYFTKRIGIATGIAAAGGSVGGMIYPAVAKQLVFKIGFPWTMRVIALTVLITIIPANLVARQRSTNKRKEKPQIDYAMFRDIPFLLITAGFFFSFWGIYFGFYFLVEYAQTNLHLTPTASINLLILLNATNLPGRLIPNTLSDACLGPINAILPITFLTSACLFLWTGATTHTSLTFVACFFGFCAGGVQGLYNACIWEFSVPKNSKCKAEDLAKAGVKVAFVFMWISAATLTGAPLGGALVSRMDGGYLGAQIFAGTSTMVGFCFLTAARVAREGCGPVRV